MLLLIECRSLHRAHSKCKRKYMQSYLGKKTTDFYPCLSQVFNNTHLRAHFTFKIKRKHPFSALKANIS